MSEDLEQKKEVYVLPWSQTAAVAFLMFVSASGGWYGNYYVTDNPAHAPVTTLRAGFDESVHTVTRIVDADTIIVDGKHKVRLIGIDAPEKNGCYYQESVVYVQKMLMGQEVLLRKDSNAKDSLDRLLRYVFIYNPDPEKDHVFANNIMLQDGIGHLSFRGENRLHADIMQVAYGIAKSNKRGIHEACEPIEESILEPPTPEHVIKGNSKPDAGTKIYYLPGCPNYTLILMRASEGDQYFTSEEDAVNAGFNKAANCKVEFETVGI